MSQDTRKDKRAKVVSLNVRYKSATVDEFIENHSHDVSKGGLFVKTPTPFPPGTLLKFEIRLAGDKSVISGVGRVVWKREPTQSGADKPAGMGVKFIKIDDSSRAIIDRLITQKADAGSAYTSETPVDEPAAGHPSTLRGLVAAEAVEPGSAPPGPSPVNVPPPPGGGSKQFPVPPAAAGAAAGPPPPAAGAAPGSNRAIPSAAPSSKPGLAGAGAKPAPRPLGASGAAGGPPAPVGNKAATVMGVAPAPSPAATISAAAVPEKTADSPAVGALPPPAAPPPRPAPPARKATMMGIGIPSTPPPKGDAATGALPSPTPPPPAAGALATGTPAPAKAAEPMFPTMDPDSERLPVGEQTVMKQAAELLEEALKEAGGSMDEIGQNPLFAKQGSEPLEPMPASARAQSGDTLVMTSPSTDGSLPLSLGSPSKASSAPGVTSEPRSVRGSSPSHPPPAHEKTKPRRLGADLDEPKKKGGGSGMLVALLLVLLLAAGGVYAWQTGMLGGATGPTPTPPSASTTSPPPSAPPSASSSAPVLAATDAAAGATDASTTATGDASTGAADAGIAADAGKPTTAPGTGTTGTTTTATTETPVKPPPPAPPKPPKPPATDTPATPPPIDIPAPAPAPAPIPRDPANEL